MSYAAFLYFFIWCKLSSYFPKRDSKIYNTIKITGRIISLPRCVFTPFYILPIKGIIEICTSMESLYKTAFGDRYQDMKVWIIYLSLSKDKIIE